MEVLTAQDSQRQRRSLAHGSGRASPRDVEHRGLARGGCAPLDPPAFHAAVGSVEGGCRTRNPFPAATMSVRRRPGHESGSPDRRPCYPEFPIWTSDSHRIQDLLPGTGEIFARRQSRGGRSVPTACFSCPTRLSRCCSVDLSHTPPTVISQNHSFAPVTDCPTHSAAVRPRSSAAYCRTTADSDALRLALRNSHA